MRIWATLVCGLLIVLAAPRVARADTIGVVPFTADESIAIYASPVAQALAAELRKYGELEVELIPLTGSIPKRVSLVVDGRIVLAKKGVVLLEAWVKDPKRGVMAVKAVATASKRIGKIDELAVELAGSLAPRLESALRDLARLRREENKAREQKRAIRLPATVVQGAGGVKRAPSLAAVKDKRPRMLVAHVGGEIAYSNIVTPHAYWLAERLGYRPVVSDLRGVAKRAAVVDALKASGAQLALLIHIRAVQLNWKKVPWGRGRIRVVLINPTGQVIFDRTARTGTLVGSRGDGSQAVIHYIAEQMVEIVLPYLKRLLGSDS